MEGYGAEPRRPRRPLTSRPVYHTIPIDGEDSSAMPRILWTVAGPAGLFTAGAAAARRLPAGKPLEERVTGGSRHRALQVLGAGNGQGVHGGGEGTSVPAAFLASLGHKDAPTGMLPARHPDAALAATMAAGAGTCAGAAVAAVAAAQTAPHQQPRFRQGSDGGSVRAVRMEGFPPQDPKHKQPAPADSARACSLDTARGHGHEGGNASDVDRRFPGDTGGAAEAEGGGVGRVFGVKLVEQGPQAGQYLARIKVAQAGSAAGRMVALGNFPSASEASRARDLAHLVLHRCQQGGTGLNRPATTYCLEDVLHMARALAASAAVHMSASELLSQARANAAFLGIGPRPGAAAAAAAGGGAPPASTGAPAHQPPAQGQPQATAKAAEGQAEAADERGQELSRLLGLRRRPRVYNLYYVLGVTRAKGVNSIVYDVDPTGGVGGPDPLQQGEPQVTGSAAADTAVALPAAAAVGAAEAGVPACGGPHGAAAAMEPAGAAAPERERAKPKAQAGVGRGRKGAARAAYGAAAPAKLSELLPRLAPFVPPLPAGHWRLRQALQLLRHATDGRVRRSCAGDSRDGSGADAGSRPQAGQTAQPHCGGAEGVQLPPAKRPRLAADTAPAHVPHGSGLGNVPLTRQVPVHPAAVEGRSAGGASAVDGHAAVPQLTAVGAAVQPDHPTSQAEAEAAVTRGTEGPLVRVVFTYEPRGTGSDAECGTRAPSASGHQHCRRSGAGGDVAAGRCGRCHAELRGTEGAPDSKRRDAPPGIAAHAYVGVYAPLEGESQPGSGGGRGGDGGGDGGGGAFLAVVPVGPMTWHAEAHCSAGAAARFYDQVCLGLLGASAVPHINHPPAQHSTADCQRALARLTRLGLLPAGEVQAARERALAAGCRPEPPLAGQELEPDPEPEVGLQEAAARKPATGEPAGDALAGALCARGACALGGGPRLLVAPPDLRRLGLPAAGAGSRACAGGIGGAGDLSVGRRAWVQPSPSGALLGGAAFG